MAKTPKTLEELAEQNERSRFEEYNQYNDLNEGEQKALSHIMNRKQISAFYIDPDLLNKDYDYSWRPLQVNGKFGDKFAEQYKVAAWMAVSPDEMPSLMAGRFVDSMGREIPKDYIRRGECALFKRKKSIGDMERSILRQEAHERISTVNSNGEAMMMPHLRTGVVLQGQRFVGSDAQFSQTHQDAAGQYGQRATGIPTAY